MRMLPRFVLWPGVPRAAGRFRIRLSLPTRLARRGFSARPDFQARREMFRVERACRDLRGVPHVQFPAEEDFLSGIFRPSRQFSCPLLRTICRRPRREAPSKLFSPSRFERLLRGQRRFLSRSTPCEPRSPRARDPGMRAPSSLSEFPYGFLYRVFREMRRVPRPATWAAAPAGPARLRPPWLPRAKIAAR